MLFYLFSIFCPFISRKWIWIIQVNARFKSQLIAIQMTVTKTKTNTKLTDTHTHTLKHEPNIIKIIIKNQLIHLNLYAKYTEKRQYSLAMQFLRFVISTIYLIWFPSHLFFGHFFLSPIQFFSLVLHFSISTLISGVTFSSKMTQNIFSYRL